MVSCMNKTTLVISTLLLFGTSTQAAWAFERTPTCYVNNPSSPFICREGETPRPIFWPAQCVPYLVQMDGVSTIPNFDDVLAAIERSFDPWRNADCASIDPTFAGLTDSRTIGIDAGTQVSNGNIITFTEAGWPNASPIQALTSVTYRVSTGEIVDADINMNAQFFTIGIIDASSPPTILDLENTLTHEAGHFLGLEHTLEASFTGSGSWLDTTMFGSAGLGETNKRSVEDDDINGICAAYPLRDDDAQCDCVVSGSDVTRPDRACPPLSESDNPDGGGSDGGGRPDVNDRLDAGSDTNNSGALEITNRNPDGCTCTTSGPASGSTPLSVAVAAVGLLLLRRRHHAQLPR